MAHRFRPSINSPLFMQDPVPTNGSPVSESMPSESSFYFKGEDTSKSNNSSYEHIGGADDVFHIYNQGGAYQLKRKTLKETLYELKTQAHVNIRNLSPAHTESFRSVIESLRFLYNSQALYDLVLVDIREIFGDIKEFQPGTVTAYFIGCINDSEFPGPLGCSPKCAAALPPAKDTPGYHGCDDLVLIYSDGLFSSLNDKLSPHAYIYIGEEDFTGCTPENIRQLKQADIENVSLVFGNQNGSYREIRSALTLDQLPIKASYTSDTSTTDNSSNSSVDNSNNTGAIVFAVIIIVIILLLLLVLYRNYYA